MFSDGSQKTICPKRDVSHAVVRASDVKSGPQDGEHVRFSSDRGRRARQRQVKIHGLDPRKGLVRRIE